MEPLQMMNESMKRCSKCKEVMDRSEFHKNKARKDGVSVYCKQCINLINLKYHRKYRRDVLGHTPREIWVSETTRRCSKCKKVKDNSQFSKDNSRKCGFNYKCKQCMEEYRRDVLGIPARVSCDDGVLKKCAKCGELKDHSHFNKDKFTKSGLCSTCRKCARKTQIKYEREVLGRLPVSENKECSEYLGVFIAERLVNHLFKDVVRMPHGHPGYDFICSKDKKVDVKSSCLRSQHGKYPMWYFHIRENTIADYFLLIAFDNRSSIEPLYQWLIPGHELNHLHGTTISPTSLDKWAKWEQPIGDTIACCNELREA